MGTTNFKFNAKKLSTEITKVLDNERINRLAVEANFIIRKGKIDGFKFLDVLLFTYFNHKELSLNDLSVEILKRYDIIISKQSIDERFTDKAVIFFKSVLEDALNNVVYENYQLKFTQYNSVRIKDSTSFQLPENMEQKYRGSGGNGSKSAIRIQFEYDLKTGKIIDLSIHAFVDQDISNTIITIDNINKNDLIIRDLGYVSIAYLQEIKARNAFYLNRLNSSTKAYEKKNGKFIEIDFVKLNKHMNKNGLIRIEKAIYIGQEKLKTRIIIEVIPDEEYKKRLKKAQKNAKVKHRKISDAKKARMHLNLFITNTDIPSKQIRLLYTLRWQIELMFKIWKSIGEIDKVKKMKLERFETFLYAKLIWIVINWHIMRQIVGYYFNEEGIKISPYKLYKSLKASILEFRDVIKKGIDQTCRYIENMAKISRYNHISDKKKHTLTWSYEVVNTFKSTNR